MELYAVACTDLHYVVGPYPTAEAAIEDSERLTRESDGCVYVPVLFQFRGMVKEMPEESDDEGSWRGQYL